MDFIRSIAFTIPGKNGKSAVEVYVVELNGQLEFTVRLLDGHGKTPDLRGLFFNVNNESKLNGLTYTNADGHVSALATGNVNDLGHGANMKGKAPGYDVGIEFGSAGQRRNDVHTTTFTLSNSAKNLTLDDIANTDFGARLTSSGAKLTAVAPAAPDAIDDAFSIFEDGQAGLDAPASTPAGVVFQVLANDTDADGQTLTITAVQGAVHGTVEIVDGDDADDLAGDAVLYTPFADYAGTDSFQYAISDGDGGTDFATVNVSVEAVADVPELSYEILAGATVNETRIRVTATQADLDSSEFLDRIELSGIPAGVIVSAVAVNPGDQPDQIIYEFVLTVPFGMDTSFDLGITAFSEETSNGDQQSASLTVPIVYDHTANQSTTSFAATDQSIWSTGDQFTFTDDRFLGIDTSWNSSSGGTFYGASDGHIKAGFQSTLTFEGGEVDATVPYDITIETNYNRTTDVLLIGGTALLAAGAGFTTEGPEGGYTLDFLLDFLLNASAGIDLGVLGSWDAIDVTLGPWTANQNIIDVDSDDLSFTVNLPAGFSLTFAWPDVDTASSASATNVVTSSGASNNFFELGLDVDDLLTAILGLPANPVSVGFDATVVWADFELIDLDLSAGLNFLQQFMMTVNSLTGTIAFEDGTIQAFNFDDDITLVNASSYDIDDDGIVEFELTLAPNATLNNNTDLGINVGFEFGVLKASGGYDIGLDSGSFSLGPVFSISDSADVASIDLYNETFALNFGTGQIDFFA